jgi:hypothetical protein
MWIAGGWLRAQRDGREREAGDVGIGYERKQPA